MNILQDSPVPDYLHQVDQPASGFFKKVSAAEKIVWLLAFVILIAFRIPNILKGRFWAEEGLIFFRNGWELPWYQALFWSHGGYLNITANFAGVLANHLAPLEKACYVSTIVALIVQMFPLLLLCTSRQKWLQNRKILVAAMLIVSTMPMTQEIWLSSIGSQCYLNLCVALILVLEPGVEWVGVFQKFLLVVTPLSGPGAICLLPFFFMRAIIDRSFDRGIQGLVLVLATTTQLLFFWHFGSRGPLGIDLSLLLNVFYVKHLVGPLLGFQESRDLTLGWDKIYLAGHLNWIPGAVASMCAFCLMAFVVVRSRKPEPVWFFAAGLLLSGLSYCGALGDRSMLLDIGVSERYDFAPQVLFELAVLFIAFSGRGLTRALAQALIIWLIVIGAHEYFSTPDWYADGPVWRAEVRQWRQNPDYKLRGWPPDWSFNLKPHQ